MKADAPNPDLGLAILRVVTGVIFVAHGAPKLFGGGVEELARMLGGIGVPFTTAAAWGITLLEFFGGLALVAGLVVVPVAILLSLHMLTDIVLVHGSAGFFVIGPQAQHPPGGVEFNLLLIAALCALILAGPGAAAADRALGGSGGGARNQGGDPAGG